MAIEVGVVTGLNTGDHQTVWVETAPAGACASCSLRDGCNPGAGDKKVQVKAVNEIGARLGDQVQLSISTPALFKAMFLLYLFPVLSMLVGALAAHAFAPRLRLDPSTATVFLALAFFVVSICIVRMGGQRLGRKAAYQPKIIRVLRRGVQSPSNDGDPMTCPRGQLHTGQKELT